MTPWRRRRFSFSRTSRLTFGGTPLLRGVDLSVGPRERLCIVGRNGSGKSTLLKIAAGLVPFDGGERFCQPSVTVRYLPQEPDLAGLATTLAYVEAGLAPGDDPYRARFMLEQLGLDRRRGAARLSGGEARRAALARVLAPEPDILLLDEPTNHLDLVAIEALEETLKGLRSAIVLISHDRRFLETLSEATVWLDRGVTRRLDRGFADFEAWRDQVLEEEERDRHKLDRRIVDEEHWLRYGVTARRKRNQGRLRAAPGFPPRPEGSPRQPSGRQRDARGAEDQGLGQAGDRGGGDRQELWRAARSSATSRCGSSAATASACRPERRRQDDADQSPHRRARARQRHASSSAPISRSRPSTSAAKASTSEATVADTLTGGRGDSVIIGGQSRHVIGYMKDFLFRPEQARTPVKALSGGEKARLMLARALAKPSNLLVLDEPTNDLDLETLDLLQEMLADYPGTLIMASHDRDFIDRVATSTLVAEGTDGRWTEYAGGYSDMVAQRGSGIGARPATRTRPASAVSKPAEPPAAAVSGRKRLSFKDDHALKVLPERIAALSAEIERMEAMLSDPNLYRRDPKTFAATGEALAKARAELSGMEGEWLRLELLREDAG